VSLENTRSTHASCCSPWSDIREANSEKAPIGLQKLPKMQMGVPFGLADKIRDMKKTKKKKSYFKYVHFPSELCAASGQLRIAVSG
jgi:hypothetical protein